MHHGSAISALRRLLCLLIATSIAYFLEGIPAQARTGSTKWEAVAACESGGRWHIATGNGYYGGLQFSAATWRQFGGRRYAPFAHQASRASQVAIAEKVLKIQGWRAWPVCSRRTNKRPVHIKAPQKSDLHKPTRRNKTHSGTHRTSHGIQIRHSGGSIQMQSDTYAPHSPGVKSSAPWSSASAVKNARLSSRLWMHYCTARTREVEVTEHKQHTRAESKRNKAAALTALGFGHVPRAKVQPMRDRYRWGEMWGWWTTTAPPATVSPGANSRPGNSKPAPMADTEAAQGSPMAQRWDRNQAISRLRQTVPTRVETA
ncbi:transglycosylase family protein [Streptomyces sp. NPDC059008]|uniref:transglycosylase family protein n=1 Tax=Streptomyces sp. NPDC059008 TaxID=3346693 RepID=UPI003681A6B4